METHKNMILILLMLLFIPFSVNARINSSYNLSKSDIGTKVSAFTNYSRYLTTTGNKFICTLSSGKIQLSASSDTAFLLAGYLNKTEYDIAGSLKSYLYDGEAYFTMTSVDASNVYVVKVNSNGIGTASTSAELYGVRLTEHVKSGVKIVGTGTRSDPWVFSDTAEDIDPILSFSTTSGTLGENGWYKSAVGINLSTNIEVDSISSFRYCTTTAASCTPSIVVSTKEQAVSISNQSISNTICATVITQFGKEATQCSNLYKVDYTNPSCTLSASATNYVVTATDTVSSVQASGYSWNTTANYTSTKTYAISDSTSYLVYVKDNAGNVGSCGKTCGTWSCSAASSASTTCTNGVSSESAKVQSCSSLYNCSKAATVGGYYYCLSGTPSGSSCISSYAASVDNHVYYTTVKTTTCPTSRVSCTGSHGGTWARNCTTPSTGYRKYVKSCTSYFMCGGSVSSSSTCTSSTSANYQTTYSCSSGTLNTSNNTCYINSQSSCAAGFTSTVSGSSYSNCTRTCSSN